MVPLWARWRRAESSARRVRSCVGVNPWGFSLNPIDMLRTTSSLLVVHMLAERALRHPRFRGDLISDTQQRAFPGTPRPRPRGNAKPLENQSTRGSARFRGLLLEPSKRQMTAGSRRERKRYRLNFRSEMMRKSNIPWLAS
jgi:hypothetical protein